MKQLREQLERRELALFLGPDLPADLTGSPSWPELATELAARGGWAPTGDWPSTATRYEQAFGRGSLIAWLDEQVNAARTPGPLCEALARLPISRFIVASYDRLLQVALEAAGRPANIVVSEEDLPFIQAGRPTIVKLLGEASPGRRQTLEATAADLRKLPQFRSAILNQEVIPALTGLTILVLGQDLRASYFRPLYQQALTAGPRQLRRRNYAVWTGLEDWEIDEWRADEVTVFEGNPLELLHALADVREVQAFPAAAPTQIVSPPPQPLPEPSEAEAELVLESLPTAVLHLYSRDNLPLVKYTLRNPGMRSRTYFLTSSIEGFSYERRDTVQVAPGGVAVLTQLPTLRLEAVRDVYEVRKAVLHTAASYLDGAREALLFRQDFDVHFLARDVMIWAIIVDPMHVHDLSAHVAAWVTSNDRAVVDLLREAARFAPSGALVGYQGETSLERRREHTRADVKAIYEAIKIVGDITYTNAPISFGRQANNVQQRVSLPRDSLATRQANCIDGAVLFASLIERAGMCPVIVLVPGHAFVGWETWRDSHEHEFLETTVTNSQPFEVAYQLGMQAFEQAREGLGRPLFNPMGFTVLLDIPSLRQQGIVPAG